MASKINTIEESTSGDSIIIPSAFHQPTLFPIEIVETYPSDQQSADLQSIGKGRDGRHYAIKTTSDNNGFVPASEFFCYQLARLVSIPTPPFENLKLACGSIAFGSVWEGGVTSVSTTMDVLNILSGKTPVQDLPIFLSKVYAFDLFVNNEDRHFGNYIFRDSFKSKIVLAFDFSRAWKETNPFGFECLDKRSNTTICNQYIRANKCYDKDVAKALLEEISKIPTESVESILDLMHDTWMSKEDKDIIVNWWDSTEFHLRIEKLMGVI